MLESFKKLLAHAGRHKQPDSHSLPSSRSHKPSSIADSSDTAVRGQLVQIMMRDLLRKSGLPSGWVQCQVQAVSSRSRGEGIYVRLIVKHWDERLMKYAFAFQKALLADIVQVEPQATQWLRGITWQLDVANSCQVTELPDRHFWQPKDHKKEKAARDPSEIVPISASAMPSQAATAVGVVAPVALAEAVTSMAVPQPFALEPLPSLVNPPVEPEDDTEKDLERLFAIRDRELEHKAVNNLLPHGYEKTEPSPL